MGTCARECKSDFRPPDGAIKQFKRKTALRMLVVVKNYKTSDWKILRRRDTMVDLSVCLSMMNENSMTISTSTMKTHCIIMLYNNAQQEKGEGGKGELQCSLWRTQDKTQKHLKQLTLYQRVLLKC